MHRPAKIAGLLLCLMAGAALFMLLSVDGARADNPGLGVKPAHDVVEQVIKDEGIQHDPPAPAEHPDIRFNLDLGWLRIPLLILLGIGLLLLLIFAIKGLLEMSRPTGQAAPKKSAETVEVRPLLPAAPESLPELEEIMRLARSGQYEAAVHLLLLHALRQVARLTGATVARSLTSREILRRHDLPEGFGRDLATLVGAVEISRFGGRSAGEKVFEACLASYHRLASHQPMSAMATPAAEAAR
jgi:Domain of unknown function (DUF4129)